MREGGGEEDGVRSLNGRKITKGMCDKHSRNMVLATE